jgi:curved DNA-binding protein CbpA
MSTDQQSLYEVVGVPPDASQALIEEQCIRLGDRYRPDNNSGDLRAGLLFAQIEKAYETLLDPVKRASYDAELLQQRAKSIGMKGAGGSVAIVVSVLAILLTLAYTLAYRPYAIQKEANRIAAEETKRVADEKTRGLEAQMRAAEGRGGIRGASESR